MDPEFVVFVSNLASGFQGPGARHVTVRAILNTHFSGHSTVGPTQRKVTQATCEMSPLVSPLSTIFTAVPVDLTHIYFGPMTALTTGREAAQLVIRPTPGQIC